MRALRSIIKPLDDRGLALLKESFKDHVIEEKGKLYCNKDSGTIVKAIENFVVLYYPYYSRGVKYLEEGRFSEIAARLRELEEELGEVEWRSVVRFHTITPKTTDDFYTFVDKMRKVLLLETGIDTLEESISIGKGFKEIKEREDYAGAVEVLEEITEDLFGGHED